MARPFSGPDRKHCSVDKKTEMRLFHFPKEEETRVQPSEVNKYADKRCFVSSRLKSKRERERVEEDDRLLLSVVVLQSGINQDRDLMDVLVSG